LVLEAVERMVNYDEWFVREVEKRITAAQRGEFVDHDEVRKLIDRRYLADADSLTDPAVRDFTAICDYIQEHGSTETARLRGFVDLSANRRSS
jgi:hypothetical protein